MCSSEGGALPCVTSPRGSGTNEVATHCWKKENHLLQAGRGSKGRLKILRPFAAVGGGLLNHATLPGAELIQRPAK